MRIEVNINKKYFIILLSTLVILTGIIISVAYGGTQPNFVGHSAGEIDVRGFCLFSISETACPEGWTRSSSFDGRALRGSALPVGGTGGAESHFHWVPTVKQSISSGNAGAADDATYNTDWQSNWPPFINVLVCCKD